ncbi:CBS domain-containing protein [Candidatus Venteria ishoeyi]|uniref:CBS domain protein n=1 Tax=Candidatus Venteria ishoeyi TaxID=1899563 RepID=A0A1H6FC33_9GAMM|nr:CBS domain-containing protein [Candidatus Venteria ishoeyi]MDM8545768.1 CBS domain-containing protein [Candidatus Venteria ishoeyi]SEH06879.1 CBS domain protein [Candidatus Venteria ishoeyi]
MMTQDDSTETQCPLVRDCSKLISSQVARPGMSVDTAILYCLKAGLPGIPFCNEQGDVVGKVSLKHLLITSCVPKDMSNYAHLIADKAIPEQAALTLRKLNNLIDSSVDTYVLSDFVVTNPDTPLYKALALMDKYKTSYFFVLDQGHYIGSLDMHCLAQHMVDILGIQAK